MARLHGQPQTQSERRFEVSLVDWCSEDEEDTGPWCVDYGDRIEVLRTRDIQRHLEGGDLDPEIKVWRDGRACWLPIAECYELTVTPPPVVMPTPAAGPVREEILVNRQEPRRRATRIGGVGVRKLGAVVLGAFVVGIGLGGVVVLPDAAATGQQARNRAAVERVFSEVAGVLMAPRAGGPGRLVAR